MTARGNFLYNSLSKSWKYDWWLLWAISFTIPHQNHINARGHFFYNPYQNHWNMTYLLGATSLTIHCQNHRNMTYHCKGQFPLQFLIKSIEILAMTAKGFAKINEIWWHLTARGHFIYNSLWTSLKYDLWMLGAISYYSLSKSYDY